MSKSAIYLWIAGIVAFIVLGIFVIVQYDKAHPDYQPYTPQEKPTFEPWTPWPGYYDYTPPVSSVDPMEVATLCALNKILDPDYENEICN